MSERRRGGGGILRDAKDFRWVQLWFIYGLLSSWLDVLLIADCKRLCYWLLIENSWSHLGILFDVFLPNFVNKTSYNLVVLILWLEKSHDVYKGYTFHMNPLYSPNEEPFRHWSWTICLKLQCKWQNKAAQITSHTENVCMSEIFSIQWPQTYLNTKATIFFFLRQFY